MINTISFKNNGKYRSFVDLESTVIFMAKFNPTITAYLVPCITEGYYNRNFLLLDESTFKVEHISY